MHHSEGVEKKKKTSSHLLLFLYMESVFCVQKGENDTKWITRCHQNSFNLYMHMKVKQKYRVKQFSDNMQLFGTVGNCYISCICKSDEDFKHPENNYFIWSSASKLELATLIWNLKEHVQWFLCGKRKSHTAG